MLLDEAIEQNKQWLKEHPHLGAAKGFKALPPYEAIQLGIEALEEIKRARDNGYRFLAVKLPSETYIPESVDRLPSDEG